MLNLEGEVLRLEGELLDSTYRPRPYRRFSIADPKPRTICAAAFRDRVVQHALCAAMMDSLEGNALSESFACRGGKGSHASVRSVQHLTRRFKYALKLDVRRFFATVDHAILKQLLSKRLRNVLVQSLSSLFIEAAAPGHATGKGLPIGNLTSQYFANFYLGPLDRLVKRGASSPASASQVLSNRRRCRVVSLPPCAR